MLSRGTVSVSSPRSCFASVAIVVNALTAGSLGNFSKTACVPVIGASISEISLISGPVENAFLPYVEQADADECEVDEHLVEAEHARSGEGRQTAEDHRPGKHEDSFYVEEYEEHCDHVEADRETSSGVADRVHSALVS